MSCWKGSEPDGWAVHIVNGNYQAAVGGARKLAVLWGLLRAPMLEETLGVRDR